MSRIIIADGDTYSCGFIYRIITRKRIGEFVEIVHDGSCAYNKILSDMYDLAIIDLSLPNFSGLNVVCKLREAGVKTKILVLSDKADPVLAKEAVLSGAQDLMEKPILVDSFVYGLKRCLQQDRSDKYELLHSLNLSFVKTPHTQF